jgi:hypothetical protein
MRNQNSQQVNIEINTSIEHLSELMKDLNAQGEKFGKMLTSSFINAAATGKDLDDVLRSLALRMSNSVFNSAMNPLENATGSLFGNIFSGLGGMLETGVSSAFSGGSGNQTINFNVTSPDADSFQRSESQLSALLNRAVSRGQRNL